ncbi:AraC family transcriptional regulator [Saccharibacillus sp. CPCC 101409]|uniref:AraC family transcriptional regulator n=1 Tax=Saccharibacillus sp. CPCC 101409 TaxID=3058041 RepID=UPI00267414D2|nr:AraC family transcriptional regulator [Saccharibacillus sp. CPCC 101409]MDO3412227.1 AraC family transcriptional regulator [Saccharibacillus sp. CPCC 101409]
MTLAHPEIKTRLNELIQSILRHAPVEGLYESAVPGLRFRHTARVTQPVHSVASPSLYIIAQGSKAVSLAGRLYRYDPLRYLVNPIHLPVVGMIDRASPREPYLSLQLDFSTTDILDLAEERRERQETAADGGLFVSRSTPELLDAACRLLRLLDKPAEIPVLAPLIIREMLYRVLLGEQGALIARYAASGSYTNRMVGIIDRINRDYAEPLNIRQIAEEAHMSSASLHKYFKQATSMSPLQYQKALRLQAARQILLTTETDAAEAGFRVGYESPSQFSREYARMFGLPPKSDVKRWQGAVEA